MCGIAGYFGRQPVSADRLDACAVLMNHRGPDGHGRFVAERAGRHAQLLHTRLSIIDLDPRADQPFREGSQVTVYNGELYNYVELKSRLAAAGEKFRTTSDTEVLAKLVGRDSGAVLDRCEGMWAFARYDEEDGSLLLSRDRFGEKPLYILRADEGIYFGSEVKFIRALCGRPLAINRDQVRRYLVHGYKALYKSPAGFFRDVREVEPGTSLLISADLTETASRYWNPWFAADADISFEQSVKDVCDALFEAVKIRLRADVPMAFCMSGGVDSNALISLAKRVFDYDVHGFTIQNTDARYEEQELVSRAVSELGIRHTFVDLSSENFVGDLRSLVRAHDAPVITISYFVHWKLMQAIAANGYKISVSGTGADELFTGYYDHHLFFLAEPSVSVACLHAKSLEAWQEHVLPWVRNPHLRDPDVFKRSPDFRGHIYLNASEFSNALVTPWDEPFVETRYCDDNLRNRMFNELFTETVPVILHEDDLNAMYYSIENRSPFLDRGLFDVLARVPTRHLIRGGYTKSLLREAVRGIAPEPILNSRRKVGFNAPILDLLDMSDPAVRAELLSDSPIFDVVKRNAMEAWLDKPQLDDAENKFVFSILSAKMFLEECSA
jgi:asparagine synthase (glutamine-hydrolysing)